ncbi:hypothetical protein [Candidatus Uabimicrobium amorphum]|uniref:Uncharacterized protein n=1 Tax=Uabimicrobium amorphum TaxID=2596890 RepID=A0A5S9F4N0_UABAM|nr:hypothetical protein [Candidatus Uabimicrobium amorphum]BBM85956.1 hypothetical protein UABAM_04342 [Candidatus Uabimicrobium amorphum]
MRLKNNLRIEISNEVNGDNKVFLAKRGKPIPTCCSFYFTQPSESILLLKYGDKTLLWEVIPCAKRVVVNKLKITKFTLSFNLVADGKMLGRHHASLHNSVANLSLSRL